MGASNFQPFISLSNQEIQNPNLDQRKAKQVD
ncbi:hypothetical protein ES332_A12G051000v1 [Gossypium tomentosum]|uniref:Uncharacterized protein n=1 Tax=Gossypium tomentosum TaxID=34277 RepID=A0A5D2MTW5_GOSTO|nr:hypothetical protein ES332_A12G051000v1 [Gossypium tomentosum]